MQITLAIITTILGATAFAVPPPQQGMMNVNKVADADTNRKPDISLKPDSPSELSTRDGGCDWADFCFDAFNICCHSCECLTDGACTVVQTMTGQDGLPACSGCQVSLNTC